MKQMETMNVTEAISVICNYTTTVLYRQGSLPVPEPSYDDFMNACNYLHSLEVVSTTERWRAVRGLWYFYIDNDGRIDQEQERGWGVDDARYTIGNYFRTRRDAEVAAPTILAAFKLTHGGGTCTG